MFKMCSAELQLLLQLWVAGNRSTNSMGMDQVAVAEVKPFMQL